MRRKENKNYSSYYLEKATVNILMYALLDWYIYIYIILLLPVFCQQNVSRRFSCHSFVSVSLFVMTAMYYDLNEGYNVSCRMCYSASVQNGRDEESWEKNKTMYDTF